MPGIGATFFLNTQAIGCLFSILFFVNFKIDDYYFNALFLKKLW